MARQGYLEILKEINLPQRLEGAEVLCSVRTLCVSVTPWRTKDTEKAEGEQMSDSK